MASAIALFTSTFGIFFGSKQALGEYVFFGQIEDGYS
jgi:hypothetical protein